MKSIINMTVKFFILFIFVHINTNNGQDVETNTIKEKTHFLNDVTNNRTILGNELVKLQLFYESLCPGCREFYSTDLKNIVLEMASYLDIHLYPYGNAQTIDNGGGNYTFICQHGPLECYGNKLHACAIDGLRNITLAALFNSCMMDLSHKRGSDDAAADVCGTAMDIDTANIKQCAKSAKGSKLLKYYGDESKKAGFNYVPYVLINGAISNNDHFKEDVCKAFKKPPPQCEQYKHIQKLPLEKFLSLDNLYDDRISSKNPLLNDVLHIEENLGEKLVKVQLFYECLCPFSRDFFTTELKTTVLKIGSYLDINVYPYGNAKTIDNGNSTYTIVCQHGAEECYGNMLHACAIDALQNITTAVLYNSCLMDDSRPDGSDDKAVDECGSSMSINSAPIKQCANSEKGMELILQYGEESKKAGFKGVPYILVDGVESRADTFKQDVCKAFKNPPPECKDLMINDQPDHSDAKWKVCARSF